MTPLLFPIGSCLETGRSLEVRSGIENNDLR